MINCMIISILIFNIFLLIVSSRGYFYPTRLKDVISISRKDDSKFTCDFKYSTEDTCYFKYSTENQYQLDMIAIVFTVFLAILGLIYAYFYLSTKKKMHWYKETLEGLGYKVMDYPFVFIGSAVINKFKQDGVKHGDEYYTLKTLDERYDLAIFNFLHIVVIQFHNPELIQEFLSPKNPYLYHKKEFMVANIKRSLGEGIAFSEGHKWKNKRKVMSELFNYQFLKAIIPKISRICDENFERVEQQFREKSKLNPENETKLNILEINSCIFSNVMLESFFGVKSTYEKVMGQPIAIFMNQLNAEISQQSFSPRALLFGVKFLELGLTQEDRKINQKLKILRGFAEQKITSRMQEIVNEGVKQNYTDIIEALVFTKQFQIGKKTSKSNYDFKELIEQFCTFFTAGTDTTAHLLLMMIYYLILNPQCEKKVRQQINEHIKSDEDIIYENLKKLKYIDGVQNQTIRMYGPGNGIFIRKAQQDHYIRNIPIQKDMCVSFQPLANHYNKKFYKDPLQFRPQRWLSQQCSKNHPYSFCGFSGGPRSCIGKSLALLESKIGLIKYMRRYNSIELPKKDFKMIHTFLYEPQCMQVTATHSK